VFICIGIPELFICMINHFMVIIIKKKGDQNGKKS